MSFPKRCGLRPRRLARAETCAELNAAATRSLKGEGKNKLRPSYGLRPFNAFPKKGGRP